MEFIEKLPLNDAGPIAIAKHGFPDLPFDSGG